MILVHPEGEISVYLASYYVETVKLMEDFYRADPSWAGFGKVAYEGAVFWKQSVLASIESHDSHIGEVCPSRSVCGIRRTLEHSPVFTKASTKVK